MEQFIQYLYEYQGGERVRNLGFMKVEPKMDKVEIHIFAKQLDEVNGIWFKKDDGSCYIAAWDDAGLAGQTTPGAWSGSQTGQTTPETWCDSQPTSGCETGQTTPEIDSDRLDYIQPSNRRFEKIQRQDLSKLARKEWRLANNNFLLHGYYNYHHLMLIEDEGVLWLGVPGIYHEKEKLAAESFGFPEFIRMLDFEVELLPEEKNTMDDFGYWCRQVEQF